MKEESKHSFQNHGWVRKHYAVPIKMTNQQSRSDFVLYIFIYIYIYPSLPTSNDCIQLFFFFPHDSLSYNNTIYPGTTSTTNNDWSTTTRHNNSVIRTVTPKKCGLLKLRVTLRYKIRVRATYLSHQIPQCGETRSLSLSLCIATRIDDDILYNKAIEIDGNAIATYLF